jgi:hypothetical protein
MTTSVSLTKLPYLPCFEKLADALPRFSLDIVGIVAGFSGFIFEGDIKLCRKRYLYELNLEGFFKNIEQKKYDHAATYVAQQMKKWEIVKLGKLQRIYEIRFIIKYSNFTEPSRSLGLSREPRAQQGETITWARQIGKKFIEGMNLCYQNESGLDKESCKEHENPCDVLSTLPECQKELLATNTLLEYFLHQNPLMVLNIDKTNLGQMPFAQRVVSQIYLSCTAREQNKTIEIFHKYIPR